MRNHYHGRMDPLPTNERHHALTVLCLVCVTALLLGGCQPEQEISPGEEMRPDAKVQPASSSLRLATFNIAMGLPKEGQLSLELQNAQYSPLQAVAEIIQRIRPDVLVLNEFDYDPSIDAAALLNTNYLAIGQNGQAGIEYPYHFRAGVNTGLDSGLDLDGNGVSGEPQDAWGFGTFPGQYGTLVLSRFPIDQQQSRTFQMFRWAELPGARRPVNADGSWYYPDEIWEQLRLASKSYWDLVIEIEDKPLHLLVFHPTPPVFDGPEDRNGLRNFDEIRFWAEYLAPETADFIVDDRGRAGGLAAGETFVIAGDFNSDPFDGDSVPGAAMQLLGHPRINSRCVPTSKGAAQAAQEQGGLNAEQQGDPAADTSDFNDEFTGNLRLDYLLPAANLTVSQCGVFWPAQEEDGHELPEVSDHRLVWMDLEGF